MAASNEWLDMPLEDILSNGNISWTGEEIKEHLAEAGFEIVAVPSRMPKGFAEMVAKEAINILERNRQTINATLVDRSYGPKG